MPGQSEAPPGRRSLLGLLGLFCLLRLFSLLRFLSHNILIWLMDGNATRGMLGGGSTSQHPRMQSQQIRAVKPRAVTPLSLRYPQLLCIFARFRTKFGRSASSDVSQRRETSCDRSGPGRVNKTPMPAMHLPRRGTAERLRVRSSSIQHHAADCEGGIESPLSDQAACCP